MGERAVRTDSDTVAAVVADAFPSRYHFREPVSALDLDDDHGSSGKHVNGQKLYNFLSFGLYDRFQPLYKIQNVSQHLRSASAILCSLLKI
jgi:hypothetical protein